MHNPFRRHKVTRPLGKTWAEFAAPPELLDCSFEIEAGFYGFDSAKGGFDTDNGYLRVTCRTHNVRISATALAVILMAYRGRAHA